MRKISILVASALVLLGIMAYLALGGLRKPQISTVPVANFIMAGTAFKGLASNDELLKLFEQTRTYHQENKLPGTLAALYFDTKSAEKGEVDVFVGVVVEDSTAVLPAPYRYKFIPATKLVQAHITSHYLVAPAPEKVRASLQNYAQEKGLPLQNFVIEQYIQDNQLMIQIPVKGR